MRWPNNSYSTFKNVGIENWEHSDAVGDSMALVVHTAHHLAR